MAKSKYIQSSRSLCDQTRDAIIKMITTEDFPDNRLPSEEKLSQHFGVSVAIIREALLLLREEGIITKKHGVGNFFHKSALTTKGLANPRSRFSELLISEGYVTSSKVLSWAVTNVPNEEVAGILNLGPDQKVLQLDRVIYANGHPAIHSRNFIPYRYFKTPPTDEMFRQSIFDLFAKDLKMEMAYGQMQFYPFLSSEEDAQILEVESGIPMIVVHEKYYNISDEVAFFSYNKYNDKYFSVNMIFR